MNLQATIGLDSAKFQSGLSAVRGGLSGALAQLKGVGAAIAPMLGLAAATAGAGAAAAALGKGLGAAMKAESLAAQLKVLTGSADTAKQVLRDLTAFSDVTPFEPEPVQEAGRALLAFGFSAGELKPLLTDVGDLASAMGADLGDVANAFGRLKAGQFGEAFERLRSLGITRAELEKQGAKFDAGGQFVGSAETAMSSVRAVIKDKFGGTMAEMAGTTEGLLSTLRGLVTGVFRELATPINDALRPMLSQAIEWAKGLKDSIANTIGALRNLAAEGRLGEAIGLALKAGAASYINMLYKGLVAAFSAAGTLLGEAVNVAFEALKAPNFWKGIGESLKALFYDALTVLQKGLADALRGGGFANEADVVESGAGVSEMQARVARQRAGKAFAAEDSQAVFGAFRGMLDQTATTFRATWDSARDILDAATPSQQLRDLIAGAMPASATISSPAAPTTSPGASAAAATRGGGKADVPTDNLARIGMFVGAGADASRTHMADTARNTRDLLHWTSKLYEATVRSLDRGAAPAAVFT